MCGVLLRAACAARDAAWRAVAAVRQVSRDGVVKLVSGVGAKGTITMALSEGRGLGREGATRLAALMREAPPMLLTKLDIR